MFTVLCHCQKNVINEVNLEERRANQINDCANVDTNMPTLTIFKVWFLDPIPLVCLYISDLSIMNPSKYSKIGHGGRHKMYNILGMPGDISYLIRVNSIVLSKQCKMSKNAKFT